jgi:hypothetical protein
MSWSFSADRKFRMCQRQWYFSTAVAHHAASDPLRQQAYLLSKLQGLAAWRGNLVDYVISEKVLKVTGRLPSYEETLAFAQATFRRQVDFARSHRLREPGMTPSKHQGAFAAWHAVEYDDVITEEALERCWLEVTTCLTNLYAMPILLKLFTSASRCIVQRALAFTINGVAVRAQPDVIVFRRRQPPLIIDWKTYRQDSLDHQRQLTCYAVALTRCQPHRDFPASLAGVQPTDIELLEVQLLTHKQRLYTLSAEDCADMEDFIVQSHAAMQVSLAGLPKNTINSTQFPAAYAPVRLCSIVV